MKLSYDGWWNLMFFGCSALNLLAQNTAVSLSVILAMTLQEEMPLISVASFIAFALSFRQRTPWQCGRNDVSTISLMCWRELDWLRRSPRTASSGSKSTVYFFYNPNGGKTPTLSYNTHVFCLCVHLCDKHAHDSRTVYLSHDSRKITVE